MVVRRGDAVECVRGIPEMCEGGLEIFLRSKGLPVKRGLSSSAAVCVLVARLANLAYARGWTTEREMEIGYLGERVDAVQVRTDGSGVRTGREVHAHDVRRGEKG